MAVASAAGGDHSPAWSSSPAVVTWRRPSHRVWPPVRWLSAALGNSQWHWCLPLSTAVLLATADPQYKQLQWTVAKQRRSAKLWRYLMVSSKGLSVMWLWYGSALLMLGNWSLLCSFITMFDQNRNLTKKIFGWIQLTIRNLKKSYSFQRHLGSQQNCTLRV